MWFAVGFQSLKYVLGLGFKMLSFLSQSLRLSNVESASSLSCTWPWFLGALFDSASFVEDYLEINELDWKRWLQVFCDGYEMSKSFFGNVNPKIVRKGIFQTSTVTFANVCCLIGTWNVKSIYKALMYITSLCVIFLKRSCLLCDLSNFKTFGSEWNICNKSLSFLSRPKR